MSHQCTICYEDFQFDPAAKDKSQLPVQSRVCSHVLCYSCMISIYQASKGSSCSGTDYYDYYEDTTPTLLACPDCRMPGAHDPFHPIVSLPICELLSERQQMIKHDPSLNPLNEEIRRQSVERRLSSLTTPTGTTCPTSLLAQAFQEQTERIRNNIVEKMTVDRPMLRLTMGAARACFWGSILMFGTIDRNQTATVQQKSVERAWKKLAEKLDGPLEFEVENPF